MSDVLHDPRRLAALARTGLMDSAPEEVFDRITRLASRILGAPVAAISLVDRERQFFKSVVGTDTTQTPLSHSLCRYVVEDGAPLTVEDARRYPRLRDHPAARELGAVAYCGVPLTTDGGYTIGTLCVASGAPRGWSEDDVAALADLAAMVTTELELRAANRTLAAEGRRQARLAQVVESTSDAIITVDRAGQVTSWNEGAERLYGYAAHEMLGRPLMRFDGNQRAGGAAADEDEALMPQVLQGQSVSVRALRRRRRDGQTVFVDLTAAPLLDGEGRVVGATSIARDATHQHRLEVELARSEDRFRRTFDDAPNGMALVSPAGRFLRVNRALCEILGYGEAELLRRTFQELTHADDLKEDLAAVRQLLSGERPTYRMEKRYLHRHGQEIWVRVSVGLVRDEQGEPMHFVSHVEDITAAKEAEATQREVESRHRVLLSSLPDTMIALYDRDLRCVLLQGSHPSVTAARYEGRALAALVTPERFALLQPHVQRALEGTAGSLEYVAADGRMYHTDVVPYRPDGDAVTGVFTVWRDMTQHRERERQARKLATIVEQSGDAIVAVSGGGTITEWNPAATRLYGYTATEAIGRPISILAGPAQRDEQAARLEAALKGRLVGPYETTRTRQDGRHVDVSVSLSPLHDTDGSLVGLAISYRDVSERRRMEDELRASREQALEASRLKSEFVANMSHEIRTPLNGVVSMAELLLDTQLTPEQTEYAQVALTSAEALMGVIDGILDFSKIEAGKLEIVTEEFPVPTAVREVCEILAPKAAERGLDLRLAIDEAVAPVVRGDANRVRQVLMNLLSNAVKFTSQGSIGVTVDVDGGAEGRQWLRLQVTDTGIGIAPDRLPHLFQPFSQADATTTRRYGGTGLGLCISKQLVELMGGEIDCRSVAGRGSTFQFTIPYLPSARPAQASPHTDLTGTRMLVIGETTAQRQWLQDRLAGWGISPDSAADSAAALQLLRRAADAGRPYAAALITHGPGGVDGLDLARAIRNAPALRATRLILVSSSAVDPGEAVAAGVDDQLVSPVRQSRLYNALLGGVHQGALPVRVSAAPDGTEAGEENRVRVLVAEDNEVNQFAAVRVLQTFGFLVDIAQDGREAVTMTARRNYAAIFMDCQMPDVDGYMATRAIRWRERGGARTPIIALTAHALEGDREKCLEAGMDDYLTKPLRLQMVESLIERLPALRPAGVAAATGTTAVTGTAAAAGATGAAAPHPGANAARPVFDPGALGELGDPQTEAALAMMFLDEASAHLPALREAIEGDDFEQVHALAHGLKGTAATVGAVRISELSRELCRREGVTLTPAAATAIHARLTQALVQTRAAVEGYLAL